MSDEWIDGGALPPSYATMRSASCSRDLPLRVSVERRNAGWVHRPGIEDVTGPAIKRLKAPATEQGMGSIIAQAKECIDLLVKKEAPPKKI